MTQIAGLIMRSAHKDQTVAFYRALGLSLSEHEHGGPKHLEVTPLADDFVTEIYAASANYPRDAILVQVDSLEKALAAIELLAMAWQKEVEERPTLRFAYVRDPDGRDVMLVEEKPAPES